MHGVKRVRQSQDAIETRKLREQSKIKEYLAQTEDIMSRKNRKDWSKDAFDKTTRMLQINPEFYTVWNYRRNILINGIFPDSSPEEINSVLCDDLSMTMAALKVHPKVYWIWNHRRWCLEHVPDGPEDGQGVSNGWKKTCWTKELFVVEKMLDLDARNFHAWDYRRYILASMPNLKSEESELAYTTRKIESSFSNFSAWHQRSKIYTSLWEGGKMDAAKCQEQEFELTHNAMYTDPSDQSVWIYHRWLIGSGQDRELLEREITVIQELLDEQPDSKWCMESLVYYKRLLLRHHSEGSSELVEQCLKQLKVLQHVDPEHSQRYKDIALDLTG